MLSHHKGHHWRISFQKHHIKEESRDEFSNRCHFDQILYFNLHFKNTINQCPGFQTTTMNPDDQESSQRLYVFLSLIFRILWVTNGKMQRAVSRILEVFAIYQRSILSHFIKWFNTIGLTELQLKSFVYFMNITCRLHEIDKSSY